MKDVPPHHPSDKQAYRFLLLMLAALDTTTAMPEELTVLTGQMAAAYSKIQAPINDPINMYRVMYFLRGKGTPRMSEVAKKLKVSFSTATRIADFLVDNQYAERLSDPKDGRLVRLALTSRGRKAHDVIEDSLLQAMRRNLNFLTVEEQSIFLILVDKITASLKKEGAYRENGLAQKRKD